MHCSCSRLCALQTAAQEHKRVRTWNRRIRLSNPAVSSSWPLGWNSTLCTTALLGSALLASASGVTCKQEDD